MVNLIDKRLDATALLVLTKGLNFAIAPLKIPIKQMLCRVKLELQDLPSRGGGRD